MIESQFIFSLYYWAQVTDKEVKRLPLSPCVAMEKKKVKNKVNQNGFFCVILIPVTCR